MARIAIDPITRIEGHLRLEVEHDATSVTDVWSTGTMFRGIEMVLKGRDPREAWIFAQRACGVCTHVHALASVRAVENALGITIPPNARLLRNILAGSQQVHDHVVHFYHLHALDWVDVTAALKADPAATAALAAANNPAWGNNGVAWFTTVKNELATYVASSQLGPFSNGYWGHPAYTLSPEQSLLLMAHYLEALDWQREVIKIHAYLGGKNPHPQTYTVGGMSVGFAPTISKGINTATLGNVLNLSKSIKGFIDAVVIPDIVMLARHYKTPWADTGKGVGNFLSYGEFPEADTGPASNLLPTGRVVEFALNDAAKPFDQTKVAETVANSLYTYSGGDAQLKHPSTGETSPKYDGPQTPYSMIGAGRKYSWLKAPRYEEKVYEVGPLARMVVGYASGRAEIRAAIDGFLAAAGYSQNQLFSTMGRTAARLLESQIVANHMVTWVQQLQGNMARGDLRVANTAKWQPSTWTTASFSGWGTTEAPRGALGHWVKITNRVIENYQMVVPTTWNGSPRDGKGQKGAWEVALTGTPLQDPTQPLEILRTVHSFDPCMGCSVHVHDPEGNPTVSVTVV